MIRNGRTFWPPLILCIPDRSASFAVRSSSITRAVRGSRGWYRRRQYHGWIEKIWQMWPDVIHGMSNKCHSRHSGDSFGLASFHGPNIKRSHSKTLVGLLADADGGGQNMRTWLVLCADRFRMGVLDGLLRTVVLLCSEIDFGWSAHRAASSICKIHPLIHKALPMWTDFALQVD